MRQIRKFGVAVLVAVTLAGGVSLEAKGKRDVDPKTALCQYLESVINYPGVSPYIRDLALSAWKLAGCDAL
jgi:hypothetical protein